MKNKRHFSACLLLGLLPWGHELVHAADAADAADALPHRPVTTLLIEAGELSAMLRDNSESPRTLSGIDALFHRQAAGFDAFDPESQGASAGLNFEHIICGHSNRFNAFTPRQGRYELFRTGSAAAKLVRHAEADPWQMESTFTYALHAPHAIDFEFACRTTNAALFGERGYAVLFFANYMNDVEDVAIHFRGVKGPGETEQWIRAEAPPGNADYNHGGTYRSLAAADLAFDAGHNFKLNLWSYDYPRFTQPFYYGRAAHGMVLILMFDRMHSVQDEIRFSLFKFKVPRRPRPAWDFQYVIHKVESGVAYGFKGRLIWKKFVSPEDCREEYSRWKADSRAAGR
ncbi:MAG: hypothetical protein AB1813_11055 [Verrucomicrobiota bacterium]